MKEKEKKEILEKIGKRLDSLKPADQDDKNLKNDLEELEKRYKKLSKTPDDNSPMDVARLNFDIDEWERGNEIARQELIIQQKLLFEEKAAERLARSMNNNEAEEKQDIPLFRVHNSLVTMKGERDRPVITYYRVNGSAGKLEETLRIAGISNKRSIYGAGESFE